MQAQPLNSLANKIDALLPQTQCTQCGYAGCKPYAGAIAAGHADINQCPPGGDACIQSIARLLDRPFKPLNTKHGLTKPLSIAAIDENICIGCTLCIKACPVDAIIGASKQMHTVISSACTGCELCLPPCPVDCIVMRPAQAEKAQPDLWRQRHGFRLYRLARDKTEKSLRLTQRPSNKITPETTSSTIHHVSPAAAAAQQRARARQLADKK
jgi:Na+-translocating ferredoxin:NAD+ oxidoreductase subunit B